MTFYQTLARNARHLTKNQASPLPLLILFDRQIQLRMGQANVKQWIGDLMPMPIGDDDLLGVEDPATHRLPLQQAPRGHEIFQKKRRRNQSAAASLISILLYIMETAADL